ncbi:hypothetical protein ACSSWA_09675 [Melioribacter sp. Ez-97]
MIKLSGNFEELHDGGMSKNPHDRFLRFFTRRWRVQKDSVEYHLH